MNKLAIIFISVLFGSIFSHAENLDRHISVTGAVFTRDYSHPDLKEAYRDPSGVIWGNAFVDTLEREGIKRMYISHAEANCREIGASLPTLEDFKRLAGYLGANSPKGYSPFTKDGKTEVLPNLNGFWFWTLTQMIPKSAFNVVFYGGNGAKGEIAIGTGPFSSGQVAARCIAKDH